MVRAPSRKVIIFATLVIVFTLGAIVIVNLNGQHSTSNTMTLHTMQIVNGIQDIDAGKYVGFRFNIPSDATHIQLGGMFSANFSVNVFIFDSSNFVLYENSQNSTALYQSGQLTSSQILSGISYGGNYYMVLDNKLSPTNQVNIKADAAYYS